MCRNIKTMYNFEPPATEDEIRAAAIQYVRKISGFTRPSRANEAAFAVAVNAITAASQELFRALETNAPSRSREEFVARGKLRSERRFPREG